MGQLNRPANRRAQTAIEYLLILAVIAAIALGSFKLLLPKVQQSSEGYYNKVTDVILGNKTPQPIPGGWCPVACPPVGGNDQWCGNATRYRTCECPAPAFGGAYCPETGEAGHLETANMVCQGDQCQCKGIVRTCDDNCVPAKDGQGNEICSALTPGCGTTTFGTNSCNQTCFKVGSPPPCGPGPGPGPGPSCTSDGNCGDGDACTTDTCVNNVCRHAVISCDDNDQCTTDSCAPATGCVHTPKDCGSLSCNRGYCVCISPTQCNDSNPCTDDSCQVGQCINTPKICPQGETCVAGIC